MKTNTPPKTETQDRIQQLKLGVDWHAEHFRVVRMCDGQSPQPAQRFTPASFLLFVQKQRALADQLLVVYEAGPGGFHLQRQLTGLGVTAFASTTVRRLSVSERMTLANMSIEMGGKVGLIEADEITDAYLAGRVRYDTGTGHLRPVSPHYRRVVELNVDSLEPLVACPPEVALRRSPSAIRRYWRSRRGG